MFPNRFSYIELVQLDIIDFDVILGMNCLHATFDFVYCSMSVMKFNVPNDPIVERKGKKSYPIGCIISCFKACKMIS